MAKTSDDSGRPRAVAAKSEVLSSRERLGLTVLAVDQARREAVARVRRSRLMRWRYRTGVAEDIEISPTSLRPADPSFADELAVGGFGLAGYVAQIDNISPFEVAPPSQTWLEALHGFSWLRHLEAAGTPEARDAARNFVQDWLRLSRTQQAFGWEPEIMARRIISWLTHENLLLDWAEPKDHDAIMLSLEHQVMYLRTSWHNALDGYPRLLCLAALVQADLCITGQADRLSHSQVLFAAELDRQILADGCHISRDPWIGVDLLLDLLPLRPCFPAREMTINPRISTAIDRMMAMLHHLRLGDGSLARFNGMGAPEQGTLSTVMAYAAPGRVMEKNPPIGPSGYARFDRGDTTIVIDAGKPPSFELAGNAYAGCLSFEMSSGRHPLFVNNGAPGSRDQNLRPAARATASHSTLCLNEQSSSRLIRNDRLEQRLGSAPLAEPTTVKCDVREGADGISLVVSHNGYAERFGLYHARALVLSEAGDRLAGKDHLTSADGDLRLAWDIPFAIHFHLHPEVIARLVDDGQAVDLLLPEGGHWRFRATGAAVSVEQSLFIAHPAGPWLGEQVVLRTVCGGNTEVEWVVERVQPVSSIPDSAEKTAP